MNDLIYALATPVGGAIAVVRLSGTGAKKLLYTVFTGRGAPREMAYGRIVNEAGEPLDQAMAAFFPAPRSYTGEDMAELYLHGGQTTVRRVLALLGRHARGARPGEFTERAFLNGKLDLAQAEAVMDLINAGAERSANSALAQLTGRLSERIAAVEAQLLDALSGLEAAIDYPEELEDDVTSALPGVLAATEAELAALIGAGLSGRVLREGARVALIAGPSSSGKTTFAHRLIIALRALGLRPMKLSLDDYYRDRAELPLEEDGRPDLERLDTLDVPLLDEHLVRLLQGEAVEAPEFDFVRGVRAERTHTIRVAADQPIVIEGIHGLNDMLTEAIPAKQKRKIYISALTQLNMDDYTPIPSSDNRLYRRIVRDMQFRGKSAEESLLLWPSVRKGEAKNIFAFQENADYYFNSAMLYELAALRKLVEPALAAIESNSPVYLEAKRLLRFIQYFLPMDDRYIPNDSILQEFLGGSIFNI